MSGAQQNEARRFNENSPRPPVPGEETRSFISSFPPQNSALTPRPSSYSCQVSSASSGDASAPLGFEPEGCSGTTTMGSNSPPRCLRWARNLNTLFEDSQGVDLYTKYLNDEGKEYAEPLHFWFACEGLRRINVDDDDQRTIERVTQLVKVIQKKFLTTPSFPLSDELKKEVDERIEEGRFDKDVFDAVQLEVERFMSETTYPNFLASEVYLQHVQANQNTDSTGCPSSSSSRDMSMPWAPNLLPTLHEDTEFHTAPTSQSADASPPELRLTKDILMATQQSRAMDVRPKPEAFAGIYLQPGTSPYHASSRAHVQYSSYNPVSRQDSELQSISSDARTESDNLSMTDSSVDGMSIGRSKNLKKQYIRHCRAIKESASLNPDPTAHVTLIPRTQRVTREMIKPMSPQVFAQMLYDKLEAVRRDRDNDIKLHGYLSIEDQLAQESDTNVSAAAAPKALVDALTAKLTIDDDNDQSILDQHVSRVWSDPTPSRSPGLASPKAATSPDRKRGMAAGQNYSRMHKPRKEKDVFSTFSVDSGNIPDFPEGNDCAGASSISSSSAHLPKSKSVPSDYADSLHKPDLHLQGHDQRLRSDISRRSVTKKSMTELTDSGVSVVSDATASRDSRMQSWNDDKRILLEKKLDAKHLSHGKIRGCGPRSGSLERPNREEWGGRAQPFLGDPGMPLLPQPHTPTQLEEARRRLEEGTTGGRVCTSGTSKKRPCKQEPSFGNISAPSNQSTLRKSRQDMDAGEYTTVVFNFCDEQFPYRTRIPGNSVTLKQFKEYLPKKGSYRYFFKTECEDVDMKVIQEEITEDGEVLPLWEGKIMAQVKTFD